MNKIEKIYEDEEVVVINKPAGIRVHEDGFGKGETVADWFAFEYPNSVSVGEPMFLQNGEKINRPGIVHRLDRDTSGVMILAKTEKSFEYIKKQFQDRLIKKSYYLIVVGALVEGEMKTIDLPIGRSKRDPRLRVASLKASGKLREARTIYRAIKSTKEYALVEAWPETGRTHQLRAHFKAINHPIICDHLYAPKAICPPGLDRQALHAFSLNLELPDGEKKTFSAPLPADFNQALDNLSLA